MNCCPPPRGRFVGCCRPSTEATLRLLGMRGGPQRSVTEEEIAASLEEGLDAGVIEEQEHQMVRNVFRLDDRQIGSMMIPRAEIVWLDANAPLEDTLAVHDRQRHTRYPVCRGGLDDVVGVLSAQALLQPLARGEQPGLAELMQPPVFVPETLSGMELLEHFRVLARRAGVRGRRVRRRAGRDHRARPARGHHRRVQRASADEDAWAVQREDGSWLMDGLIPVPELKDRLELKELPEEDRGRYNTLAGMVMLLLGRLPRTADAVEWDGWRFEVVDLDGKRRRQGAGRTERACSAAPCSSWSFCRPSDSMPPCPTAAACPWTVSWPSTRRASRPCPTTRS
jgi:putative hemolysin